MTMQEMAAFLRAYDQKRRMVNDVHRYTAQVSSCEACPHVFGMDFPAIFSVPDSEKSSVFLAQEQRAELLRCLMAGKAVDDFDMENAFGFTAAQLQTLQRAQQPLKKPIPDNLCVLCFDDALKSHYTHALPILQKYGFHATFFITEMQPSPRGPGFEDKTAYMTWEEIAELEKSGFEIANHSLNHIFGSQDMGPEFNLAQIRGMEAAFAAHGLPKPVTYAYPSGISNPEVVACARACGYRWGRGNQEQGKNGVRGMTYYDPLWDSPLAICNFGDPDFYTEELLHKRIADTPPGTIFGLTYHDVTPERWLGACSFERQMGILAERGMNVIAVRELEDYIDPEKAWEYTKDVL